jgi:Spy/CpxP family protein refolding chaperone
MSEIDRDLFASESVAQQRGRRRVVWLSLALAGLAAAVASLVALGGSNEARAMRGLLAHAHGPHGHGPRDPEAMREHAELGAEWLLRWVDASEAQHARVREIVAASVEALVPLAEQHRAHHRELVELLAQPTVDRAALEQLRAQELALAETASRALVASLADVAEALTPEQRAELLALAARFRR